MSEIGGSTPMIPDVAFKRNANQRTLCALVLDGSGSMSGPPIQELNQGLRDLQDALAQDTVARERVRLMVVRVGDADEAQILQDWTDAVDFSAPTISANGSTPIGMAMDMVTQSIEQQKQSMKQAGISYTRPLVYLITDGAPTDQDWTASAARCASAIQAKKFQLFAIGTEGAAFENLKLFGGTVLKMKGLAFRELFQFLSNSASSASRAGTGQNIQTPLPQSVTIVT